MVGSLGQARARQQEDGNETLNHTSSLCGRTVKCPEILPPLLVTSSYLQDCPGIAVFYAAISSLGLHGTDFGTLTQDQAAILEVKIEKALMRSYDHRSCVRPAKVKIVASVPRRVP